MTADYFGIALARLIAVWAKHHAECAYRAAVMMALVYAADWVRSYDLRNVFGPGVYHTLRQLHEKGYLDRQERPGGIERDGRPNVFYRWRT